MHDSSFMLFGFEHLIKIIGCWIFFNKLGMSKISNIYERKPVNLVLGWMWHLFLLYGLLMAHSCQIFLLFFLTKPNKLVQWTWMNMWVG